MYGINLRYKTPLIAAVIGGAAGGLYAGLLGVRNYGGGSPGLMTLPGYIGGDGFTDLVNACIGAGIAFVVSFIATLFLFKDEREGLGEADGKKEEKVKSEERKEAEEGSSSVSKKSADIYSPAAGKAVSLNKVNDPDGKKEEKVKSEERKEAEEGSSSVSKKSADIYSPAAGKAVSLNKVNDPTFAQEILGKGMAVIPAENTLHSPVNGEVVMVFNTEHAIGLKSDDGAEVLIHVGIDTVNLNGEHYHALVKTGDLVKIGDPILEVDLDAVKGKGYDIITPVLITNSSDFADIVTAPEGDLKAGDFLAKAFR